MDKQKQFKFRTENLNDLLGFVNHPRIAANLTRLEIIRELPNPPFVTASIDFKDWEGTPAPNLDEVRTVCHAIRPNGSTMAESINYANSYVPAEKTHAVGDRS